MNPKTNVSTAAQKAPDTRVLSANGFDTLKTVQKQHNDKTLTPALTNAIKVIRDVLNTPTIINQAVEDHGEEHAIDVLTGALCIATHIMPGNDASITAICTQTAQQYPQFSYNVLMRQSKPVLLNIGVLVKINAKKMRWISDAELQNLHQTYIEPTPGCTAPASDCNGTAAGLQRPALKLQREQLQKLQQLATRQCVVFCKACNPKRLIYAHQRKKAKADPYLNVLPDGRVEQIRRPFTPPYTKEEAKLLRARDEAKAKAALIEETRKLNERAHNRELQKVDRDIERQQQELRAAAALELTELQIKQAYDAQKWATFQKPAIVMGVIGALALIITNMDKLPNASQPALQATVPSGPSMPVYVAPNWGEQE